MLRQISQRIKAQPASWKATLRAIAVFAPLFLTAANSAAAEPPQGTLHHLFWKVTGSQGVVYLFGTIHIGKADFYPLPQVVEDDFRQADTLVEEVNLDDPDEIAYVKQWVTEHGSYPIGDLVTNHLSAVTRSHLADYLKKSQQLEALIARMRPWLISVLITELESKRLGLDPSKGLDKHFLNEAREQKKPIETLESVGAQLKLFVSLPQELEDELLLSSLVDTEKSNELLDAVINAWQSGDAETLQALTDRTVKDYPQLKTIMKKLVDDRNDAMTAKIEQFLATPKTYFIAVGAGHLIGDRGIVNQLRAKQLTVEQQ
jgi:uncharacterized protein YbaP (TraB family)